MAERRLSQEPTAVDVVYALPHWQCVVQVAFEPGLSVMQAVERSGLPARFPEILARPLHCAVFGQLAPLERAVRPGDRIEILRPLLVDPKENRRRTAARARGADRAR